MFKGICHTCILFLICPAASVAVAADDASLVIRGARIWMGDPRLPWAEAVAIRAERILARVVSKCQAPYSRHGSVGTQPRGFLQLGGRSIRNRLAYTGI
jgi:hypothetical protein